MLHHPEIGKVLPSWSLFIWQFRNISDYCSKQLTFESAIIYCQCTSQTSDFRRHRWLVICECNAIRTVWLPSSTYCGIVSFQKYSNVSRSISQLLFQIWCIVGLAGGNIIIYIHMMLTQNSCSLMLDNPFFSASFQDNNNPWMIINYTNGS